MFKDDKDANLELSVKFNNNEISYSQFYCYVCYFIDQDETKWYNKVRMMIYYVIYLPQIYESWGEN